MSAGATKFNVGDLVKIKGGGPTMTVEEHRSNNIVAVAWFLECELFRDAFHANSLERVYKVGEGFAD